MRRRDLLATGSAFLGAAALGIGPARAAGTGNIFVSTERGNEVVVLDKDYNVINRIPTSRRPRDMHFTRDRKFLYVACGDDDALDVIDVEAQTVVDSIPTGPSPEMFEFSEDETIAFVSDEEDSRVEAIDLTSRISIMDIPTGAEPEGLLVVPGGKTVYATSEVADMVHVVDLEKQAVVKNIVVGTRPRRMILTPDGKQLWVSCELSSEIYVIDTSTYEFVRESLILIPQGFREEDVTPVGMAITKDGSRVLASLGRANHVAVIDTATYEVIKYVLVGSRVWSVDLSSDEKIAIAANGLSDDITIINMETLEAVRSVPIGRVPHTVLIDD